MSVITYLINHRILAIITLCYPCVTFGKVAEILDNGGISCKTAGCNSLESNGTVMSTNWKEVGSKEVEGTAPDGMELRKWEY
ncbi:suppressor of G2 allele of SKP1 [Artemisia annua]|uniref:Suppressor of G2 allele of SKP1 n=1 Tax=Artemisia annua TaxID=35608 RepID=A0A2U1Q893_ARTAN|nr:suppressor of G2 allele of SKP1 [Artemisia annua]